MSPEALVNWIWSQKVTEVAVGELNDTQLVAVRGFLSRDYDFNGLTGHLLGICYVEEAKRFEAAVMARPAAPEFSENPNWPTQQS